MTSHKNTLMALLERAHQTGARLEVVERLRWFVHFAEHRSVSMTCKEFSIARTTFYRWYYRLNPDDLSTLENAPKNALHRDGTRNKHTCPLCKIGDLLCGWKARFMAKPAVSIAIVAAVINISLLLFMALPRVAAASSWAPTLIVNTEAFQQIDGTDTSNNYELRFGNTGSGLTLNITDDQFEFDTDLEIQGTASGKIIHAQDTLTSSGTVVWEGAASGASLYVADGFSGSGLADCDNATDDKLLWDTTTQRFSCGSDQNSGGGGGGAFSGTGSLQAFFDNRYVETGGDTMTGALVFNPDADSTTLFQIFDADGGDPIFNIDTTNERVGI
ncbi:MAG: helix-turn-helix domain-containing protein, partial [Anaerolineales bacterium]|nr:helix-turn-helix domain-containing protein [Anaerolineales bacterium]